MEEDKELAEIKAKFDEKKQEEQNNTNDIIVAPSNTQEITTIQDDNALVNALVNNETAVDIAKQKYQDQKNQKNIANKMGKVVNRKTNADIETANIKVEEQEKNNRVKK